VVIAVDLAGVVARLDNDGLAPSRSTATLPAL
jgi:hypothetical protein